eukprot:1176986-Prorocentrum_minimum.AAC.1
MFVIFSFFYYYLVLDEHVVRRQWGRVEVLLLLGRVPRVRRHQLGAHHGEAVAPVQHLRGGGGAAAPRPRGLLVLVRLNSNHKQQSAPSLAELC